MIRDVFCRSAYNYDMDLASTESGLACEDVSLAKQSFKDEVDINTIVKRFGLDGSLPENVRMPTFGDFTGLTDYQEALNAVISAQESFDAMPARVRQRFGNDASAFVAFCSDDSNREEAVKLGLVDVKVEAKPVVQDVRIVEPEAPKVAPKAPAQGST